MLLALVVCIVHAYTMYVFEYVWTADPIPFIVSMYSLGSTVEVITLQIYDDKAISASLVYNIIMQILHALLF